MSEKEPPKTGLFGGVKAGLDKVLDVIGPSNALQTVKLPDPVTRSSETSSQQVVQSRPTATALIEPATPVITAPIITPGWHELPAEHLPKPTYWPVVMALGIIFGAFGIVTTFIISGVGLVLFIISIIGWIGDIRDEQQEH